MSKRCRALAVWLACLLLVLEVAYCRRNTQSPLRNVEPLAPVPHRLEDVFQVHPPVLTPAGAYVQGNTSDGPPHRPCVRDDRARVGKECTRILMEHSFGFSYGHPYVGESCRHEHRVAREKVDVEPSQALTSRRRVTSTESYSTLRSPQEDGSSIA